VGAYLRIVETKDMAAIRPLYDAWLSIANGEEFGLDIDSDVADVNGQTLCSAGGTLLVAYDKQDPVGFFALSPVPSAVSKQTVVVCTFWFALPNANLVGPRLIEAAKDWTARNGYSHLLLSGSKIASDSHDKICRYCERVGAKHFETIYLLEVA